MRSSSSSPNRGRHLKNLTGFLSKYKFYVYFCLLIAINHLWFLDFHSILFITFALLLTMPFAGMDFILSLVLIFEDGILKTLSLYLRPDLLELYFIYLGCIIALVALVNYFVTRTKRERYELLSSLHKLKSEQADLEDSIPEAKGKIEKEDIGFGIPALIRSREDSYKNILTVIRKTFHPFTIMLYFFDSHSNSFYVREYVSESEYVNSSPVDFEEGIIHAVAKDRRLVNIRRLKGSKYMIPYYDRNENIQSVLALPLLSGRRLKGILCMDSLEPGRFTSKEEEIVRNLAGEIVKVIDSSETMLGLAKIRQELQNIGELGTRLNENLSQSRAVDILMDITRKFVDYDFGCYVAFNAATGKNHIVKLRSDIENKDYEGRDFSCDDKLGLSSWVIRNNVPLEYCQLKGRKKEIILFNKKFKLPFKYNSVMILPIGSHNTVLGSLIIASHRGYLCRAEEKKMIEGVCAQVGIAIENARMYETLRHLASVDGLTQLQNHRVFQEILSDEIERFKRVPEKFSLILLDIDHFKSFNDEYGHPIGDFVLKEISQILRSMVRKIDTAARYGGEEFALILVNTDEEGSVKLASRIRKKVESSVFQKDPLKLKVTISLGIATYPTNAQSQADLIDSADKALYWSKEKGRNRATHFSDILKHLKLIKDDDLRTPTAGAES